MKRKMVSGIIPSAMLILGLQCTARAENLEAKSAAIENEIVAFCKANMDKKVGSGQCAALAVQALKVAGAKPKGEDAPEKGDYAWGKQIYLLEGAPDAPRETGRLTDVHPGDIIQYRDTKFITAHAEHHTSIVADVDTVKRRIAVFQQNIAGKEYVMEGLVRIDNLKEGWIRIYRPLPEK